MSDVDGLTATLDDPAPTARSVGDVDREIARCAADAAVTDDPALAANLEQRLLELEGDRRVAQAVARAQQRRAAADRVRGTRADFEALERDLPPQLIAVAADIDRWVEQGRALVERYNATVEQLAALHDLALVPARPGAEFELLSKRRRLAVQAPLAEALARQGVIALDIPQAARRDATRTVEAHVTTLVASVLSDVRRRLPSEADTGEAP